MSIVKKVVIIIAGLAIAVGLVLAGVFIWRNFSGIAPIFSPATKEFSKLKLPPDFELSVFAENLPDARVLARDRFGNFWVSQPSQGIITILEIQNGKVTGQNAVFRNLKNPHGLAIDPQNGLTLYFAEEDKISRVGLYSDGGPEKIADLPAGGNHLTRTLGFGPDDRLYVSIGSSCNVCVESDSQRAKIFSMKKDGSDFKEYARGLRNSVFFTWSYVDGRMWATEMGRDLLGDNLPPDEINIIELGDSPSTGLRVKNYGWPVCYSKNIHDTEFDKNTYFRNPCMEPFETPSYIDIPAHSAPLGLAFVPEECWPQKYWYNLLVAYHGSWNRTEPTGYKIVRVKLDAQGKFLGIEDFITGWLEENGSVIGRPVDIFIQPGGTMYVTDDKAGVVYKISLKKEPAPEPLDAVKLTKPSAKEIVKSPLIIEGSARGFWFFEASFPIKLLDANGTEIAVNHAEALSDWMTTDFVPFRGTIEFQTPATDTGTLVLEKDNPSGLPENAAEVRFPVRFR